MKKLNKFIEAIEASNEIFDKMSPAEKRVAIAQDCIERIRLGQLEPERGRFISDYTLNLLKGKHGFDSLQKNNNGKVYPVKKQLNSLPSCSACAKGSLFLSYVGRVNSFNSDEFSIANDNNMNDNAHAKLLELFSLEQLALIEYAFEGTQYIDADFQGNEFDFDDKYTKIQKFHNHYQNETNRMIGICKNIIKNNGEFIIK